MWGERAREAGMLARLRTGNKGSNNHQRHRPAHPRAAVLRAPMESHFLSPFLRCRNYRVVSSLLGKECMWRSSRGLVEQAGHNLGLPTMAEGARQGTEGDLVTARCPVQAHDGCTRPEFHTRTYHPTPLPISLPNVSEKLHLSQDDERGAKRVGKTARVT